MPQPRRSTQGKRAGASGARKSARSKPASAKKQGSPLGSGARKPAGRTKVSAGAAGTRSAGGRAKGGRSKAGGRGRGRTKPAAAERSGEGEVSAKAVAELREALSSRLIDPLDLVMLTRERIEEALGDAVTRGRVTA